MKIAQHLKIEQAIQRVQTWLPKPTAQTPTSSEERARWGLALRTGVKAGEVPESVVFIQPPPVT